MLKINKEVYKDKVYACWIGKNIGGTMGAPYECVTDMQDIDGFITPSGMPTANDDLDLQLIWLVAMEKYGPYSMSSQILSEYWINYIPPHWNEYGIGKSNLKVGLLPPMSGELNNSKWKNSNGAWIRSEIWACLSPGLPDVAIKYAFMDASVDHGLGEGTYAELFTAAIESAAFVESDIRKLIEIGLSKIPPECRVARSINLVINSFDKGTDWKATRNLLVEDSADIGWFQAPANLGFVILGLLYGNGDFKKSMICAINCGDDTDCTGATLGALLGIINGVNGIPEDWRLHIGDNIITTAIDPAHIKIPKNCTELTERVINMAPIVIKANDVILELTNELTIRNEDDSYSLKNDSISKKILNRSRYSYDTVDFIYASARIEFDDEPIMAPDSEIKVKMRLFNNLPDPRHLQIKLHLPEGWVASDWNRNVYLDHQKPDGEMWEATIHAGESVDAINTVLVEITSVGRPTIGVVPFVILG